MPLPVRRKRGGPLDARLRERGAAAGPPTVGGGEEATLQLAIGREGVGLELSGPIDFVVAKLLRARTKMVGVGFPLDVSGGVERFRHRRTSLENAVIAIDHGPAERWLSSIANDLVGVGAAEARLAWTRPLDLADAEREEQAVWNAGNVRIEIASLGGDEVVAFDLAFAPEGPGVVAIAHRVRAVATPVAPSVIVGGLLKRIAAATGGRARGLRLEILDPARIAMIQAFVVRGARVPTRADVVVSAIEPDVDRLTLTLARGATAARPSSLFVALDELDRIVADGDAALVSNEPEAARDAYLRALERAPTHAAIVGRLAELDAYADGRAEAALGFLREAKRVQGKRTSGRDGNDLGRLLLSGMLHQRAGVLGRARAAWERAGAWALERGEPRLAARALSRAATTIARDDDPQLHSLLDRAIAADPTETEARWRRAKIRVAAGDDAKAMEDVQHLEASARGRVQRRATLLRAGELWRDVGRLDRAVATYERALRYSPDDRASLSGLGMALLAAAEHTRGIALLARAATLEGDEIGRAEVLIDLARALADHIGDLPAAIARLREIPNDDRRVGLARALEGAYRMRLGDRTGAERALALAVETVERRGIEDRHVLTVRQLLAGAAKVFRDDGEMPFAMRLAMSALSLAPHDGQARALVDSIGRAPALPPRTVVEPTRREGVESDVRTDPGIIIEPNEPAVMTDADVAAELRAEILLSRVKANPDDTAAIEEVAGLLGKLGRDHELFALLSARYDDASPEERSRLAPQQRAVLHRLAEAAEREGRNVEAQLYREVAATRK